MLIARELLGYDLDLMLLYSGHNEFEEFDHKELADLNSLPLQRSIARFATTRVLNDWLARYRVRRLQQHFNSVNQVRRSAADRPWANLPTEQQLEERMAAFRTNLDLIITLCQSQGVPVIIGTVPSNHWTPWIDPPQREARALYEQGRYQEGYAAMRKLVRGVYRSQSSDAENEIILSLARAHGIPLADVRQAVVEAEPHGVPGETLIYDECHLNEEGNDIWVATYKPLILSLFK